MYHSIMSQRESMDPKVRYTWEQIPFSSSVTLDKSTALSLSFHLCTVKINNICLVVFL